MIFDTLNNALLYKGFHAKLDLALEDMLRRDFSAVGDGVVRLGDSGVYFSAADVALKSREDSRWECHDLYIDIQFIFSGDAETIEFAPRGSVADWDKSPDGDIYFSDDAALRMPLKLDPGSFAVFFPQDAHRPAQGGAGEKCRKIVYKIPVNT